MAILEMEGSMMIWLHSEKCFIKDLNLQLSTVMYNIVLDGLFCAKRPVAAKKMFHEMIQNG
jgi:pentatricopeptide repeat protein